MIPSCRNTLPSWYGDDRVSFSFHDQTIRLKATHSGTEHGMAYRTRVPGSRSLDSSRGDHVPPGRTGEPFTGRSQTGGQLVSNHAVREMRTAILELTSLAAIR